MNWTDGHIMQIQYWLDLMANLLPVVLVLAIIFTFFLVRSFAKQITRMAFYLDRIDNHMREITYFLKEYEKSKISSDNKADEPENDGS